MDIIGFILMVLLLLSVFVIMPLIMIKKNKKKVRNGTITAKNGNIYDYQIGDNLSYKRNGIVVNLRTTMPSFYIDTLNSNFSKKATLESFYNSNILRLEGEFGSNFRVFCPKEDKSDVLAILSPDIMEVVFQSIQKFDIQVQKNLLWLLSDKKIMENNEAQLEIINNAINIINEIDHKMKTYNPKNYNLANQQSQPHRTIRILGHYFSKSTFLFHCFILLIFLCVVWPLIFVTQKNLLVITVALAIYPLTALTLQKLILKPEKFNNIQFFLDRCFEKYYKK